MTSHLLIYDMSLLTTLHIVRLIQPGYRFSSISLIMLFKRKVTSNIFFQGIPTINPTSIPRTRIKEKRVYLSGIKAFAGLGGAAVGRWGNC